MDPHIFNDIEDEGGGAADARVIEGVTLYPDFPENLKFLGMVLIIF